MGLLASVLRAASNFLSAGALESLKTRPRELVLVGRPPRATRGIGRAQEYMSSSSSGFGAGAGAAAPSEGAGAGAAAAGAGAAAGESGKTAVGPPPPNPSNSKLAASDSFLSHAR